MTDLDATQSGAFLIRGSVEINRLGFGAMRVAGPGVWGEPSNREDCKLTLQRLPDLGINFIDTADSYGPDVSEVLLAEVLRPYKDLHVATKAGYARTGPNTWRALGRPEYLLQQAHKSLRNLRVHQIDLWQLHCVDAKVPRDEQFGAVKQLLDDGLIAHAGLCNVTVEEIEAARQVFPVATVQNRFNLIDRGSEPVVEHCERHGIGFIPWFPLAAGDLAKPGSLLDEVAQKHQATPSQIALAWVLKRSAMMIPIPGTSKVAHLEENVAAAAIELSDEDFAALDRLGRAQFDAKT